MKLEPASVELLMHSCLARDQSDTVHVDGLVNNFSFSKSAIKMHAGEIKELLDQLPDAFQARKGGGWSFLNACNDRTASQWTGTHRTMEQLICLGIAAGQAKWLMREMADIMPGGVPYVVVGLEPGGPQPQEPIGITV